MIELYNAECIEKMKELISKGVKVDAIICDPPYGTTKCKWDCVIPFEDMWECLKAIRKEGCPIVLFGTEPFSSYLRISNIKEFKYDWVWQKSKSGSAFTAKYRPVCKHEMISIFGHGTLNYYPQCTKGEPYKRVHREHNTNNHKIGFNGSAFAYENEGFRYPITVQEFQQKWRRQDQIHPTQKPVELMEYLVKTYSKAGDTVLDFTMGSGTTGIACKNLNRNFIGIEKDETYFEIAKQRIDGTEIKEEPQKELTSMRRLF